MVLVNKIYEYNEISREQWIEILQDTRVINDELKKYLILFILLKTRS